MTRRRSQPELTVTRRATYVRANTGVVECLSERHVPYERPVGVQDTVGVDQPFGNERGQS